MSMLAWETEEAPTEAVRTASEVGKRRVRVAINGAAGRIGKLVLRRCLKDPNIAVVTLNDLATPEQMQYQLMRDSVHGKFGLQTIITSIGGVPHLVVERASVPGEALQGIDDHVWRIAMTSERDPSNLKLHGVDILIEATGAFTKRADIEKYRAAGAHRVILTAPANSAEEVDVTLALGVNDNAYDPAKHFLVSNASCTTNCLAPILKVLHRHCGIVRADMITVHARTNDQRVADGVHRDPRRARDAGINIIPTSTGAAKAIGLVIPELAGKVNGIADRVPVADVSQIYIVAQMRKKSLSAPDLNAVFHEAACTELRGILEYSAEPLVSSDIIGNSHSAIVDSEYTLVNESLIRMIAWYDNEWGYSCRVVDLAKHMMGIPYR